MFARYVGKMLVRATVLIVSGLTMAVWIAQSLRVTHLMAQSGVSNLEFMELALYLMPDLVMLALPLGFALATAVVYQRLKSSSQLVIAQSAGMSSAEIALPLFVFGAFLVSIMYSIALYISPLSMSHFKDLEAHLLRKVQILSAAEGGNVMSHGGLSIFARRKTESGALQGIVMHDRRDPHCRRSISADIGYLAQGKSPRLILESGKRVDFNVQTQRVTTIHFERYEADLSNAKFLTENRIRKPYERFLGELLHPPELKTDPEYAKKLQSEAHQRLISPLYTIIFSLLSFLSVLRTTGRRYVPLRSFGGAVGSIILVECLNLGLFNLAAQHVWLNFMNYGIVFSMLCVLLFILFQPNVKGR